LLELSNAPLLPEILRPPASTPMRRGELSDLQTMFEAAE
jgi:hypothetical protein